MTATSTATTSTFTFPASLFVCLLQPDNPPAIALPALSRLLVGTWQDYMQASGILALVTRQLMRPANSANSLPFPAC